MKIKGGIFRNIPITLAKKNNPLATKDFENYFSFLIVFVVAAKFDSQFLGIYSVVYSETSEISVKHPRWSI